MAKKYDFKKAAELIEREKSLGLVSAEMGMRSDWFWTAEEVWDEKAGYLKLFVSLPWEEEMVKTILDEGARVGGIDGTVWDVPILKLIYKDGKTWEVECHDEGESEGTRPSWV